MDNLIASKIDREFAFASAQKMVQIVAQQLCTVKTVLRFFAR